MTATFWSDSPKNRYAAERAGIAFGNSPSRDAHSVRRRTNALIAGVFLTVNLAVLSALVPGAINGIGAAIALPNLSAPSN